MTSRYFPWLSFPLPRSFIVLCEAQNGLWIQRFGNSNYDLWPHRCLCSNPFQGSFFLFNPPFSDIVFLRCFGHCWIKPNRCFLLPKESVKCALTCVSPDVVPRRDDYSFRLCLQWTIVLTYILRHIRITLTILSDKFGHLQFAIKSKWSPKQIMACNDSSLEGIIFEQVWG